MPEPTRLLSPARVGALELPNRTVMAPMTRTRATDRGVQGPLNALYYAQRASAGLMVTECTQISWGGRGILRAPGIHEPEQVEGWKEVVRAVHEAGGRIFLQLWHPGRVSHPTLLDGELPVAPSEVAATGLFYLPDGRVPYPTPRALATAEIAAIVDDFTAGARNAKEAGFDGVELHGAFGYLPDQFLQSGTNQRGDAYGGPVENRARFLLETVEGLVGVWGGDRVGVKLSPSNRFYGMFDDDAHSTFGYAVRALDAAGVAYVHLMEPNATDLASGTVQIAAVAETFRPLFPRTVIANGGFDAPRAEAAIAAGTADLVSFGALFIANPDLPERFARDAGFNAPDPSTFYGTGPGGYTDYPPLP